MDDISARREAHHQLRRRDVDDSSGGRVRVSALEAELLARWRDDVARHWKLLLGMGLPSATWAIGLLVGIELVFTGSGLIATAIAGRTLARDTTSRLVTA